MFVVSILCFTVSLLYVYMLFIHMEEIKVYTLVNKSLYYYHYYYYNV